ncbi:hypothetical protein [Pararhizobium qamdonense]|uniref:hypothetical protein n=1 Tax=Pararhizobium qamdonense TaxID=3031126 RepID=UPI0023E0C216|nr:hypothetical protein [Pararhizobium qamdonense]
MSYSDPLHELVDDFLTAEAVYNSTPMADENTPVQAAFSKAVSDITSTTALAVTFPGAMAALRLANRDMIDNTSTEMVEPLVKGAMAYLDGIEAKNGSALADAVRLAEDLSVSEVSGLGWVAIYDALSMCIHGMEGIVCQPRCEGQRNTLNPAGQYIEALVGFLLFERRRIMAACKASIPTDKIDKEVVDRLIFVHEVYEEDMSFSEMSELAQKMGKYYDRPPIGGFAS